jgi:hypothetical protein
MVRAAIEQALELRRERGEPIPAEGWAATELVEVGWVKRRDLERHLGAEPEACDMLDAYLRIGAAGDFSEISAPGGMVSP